MVEMSKKCTQVFVRMISSSTLNFTTIYSDVCEIFTQFFNHHKSLSFLKANLKKQHLLFEKPLGCLAVSGLTPT